MPELDHKSQFLFHSDAVGDDTFLVEAFAFREEMSTPFSLEITLLTTKQPDAITPEDMIKNEAFFELKHAVALKSGEAGITSRLVYGMVSSFEMVEKVREYIRCRVVMVPRLWKLSLNKGSRVYQDADIEKLVGDELKLDPNSLTSEDFEFKLTGNYSPNEYVVQYNETDLDFVHRWLEAEGIYYYFAHSDETKDKIVFADSPEGYLSSIGTYRYRPPGELQSLSAEGSFGAEEAVRKFVCHISKLPASVKLRDYNYRKPSVKNEAESKVEESSGVGIVYEYGDHFKTPAEGAAIAKVRSEEIRCREKVFEGMSDIRPLRPGAVFGLEEHFNSEFNGDYVVLSVNHRMKRTFSAAGILGSQVEYDNDFKCIKSDLVFRPERKTEWPVLLMMNAVVDAGGSGEYAEIDDQGRYKVKLPFDCSDAKDGKASRWIRMAQPYAGANMGMHFPLHKGTEVLLTFIDGDPDRPIISAAVPNPETGSPVKGSNQTHCAIHTGGGIRLDMEDADGNQRFHVSTPTQSSYIQLGSKTDGGGGSTGTSGGQTGAPAAGSTDGAHIGTAGDLNFDNTGDHVHRTGGNATVETTGNETTITKGNTEWETHGDSKTLTKGKTESVTIGDSKSKVQGNSESEIIGNSKSSTIGNSTSFTQGDTDSTFIGKSTSKTVAESIEVFVGNKNSGSLAVTTELFVGAKLSSTNALSTEANKGGKIVICDLKELKTANQRLEESTADTEIKGGKITIDSLGELILDASTKITLKCGGSEITIEPASITIKSASIKHDASGSLESKSGGTVKIQGSMLDVSGQAMHK
jgi:type VI secretion system secreted protein VgrG